MMREEMNRMAPAYGGARFLSVVLHPLLMSVYALFFLFGGNTMFALIPAGTKLYCYLVTFWALFLMPLCSLPVFKHFCLIRGYGLNDKQERVYPILVAVVCAFVGFWLLKRVMYTQIVQQLYLIVIILLSVFSVITLRWKMSMHMTAAGGACAFVMMLGLKYPGDMRGAFMLMLLLAGMLGAARLYLKKHTPAQVYAGFLFGFGLVTAILF